MKIGLKIILEFVPLILLVGIFGFFAFRVIWTMNQNFETETKVSGMVLKISENSGIAYTATLSDNITEFTQLQGKSRTLSGEIDSIEQELQSLSTLRDNPDFTAFVAMRAENKTGIENIFQNHSDLLTRKTTFGQSPLVEEAVRTRLRSAVYATNDLALIKKFEEVEDASKKALFEYPDKEHVDVWLASISSLQKHAMQKWFQDKNLVNQLSVYMNSADIMGEIIVRDKAVADGEHATLSLLKENAVKLAELRDKIVGTLEQNATHATNTSQIVLIVISLIVLISTSGFSIFISRSISKPVASLMNGLAAFAAGNLNKRVTIVTHDEFGDLATSFNHMAGELQRLYSGLESQVAARTTELAQKVVELSERETEVREANERLRELDKVKSEFISVAAHQLRTPLSAVKWVLGLLIDENTENLTAEQKSLLLKGFESNERMIKLINKMLIVVRIESGKIEFSLAPIHIEDVIESTVLDFASQAYVRKIALTFDPVPERLPYIRADAEQIRGVVQNLIENAIRYTGDGGSIHIRAGLEGAFVKVAIEDSGIGIPAHQQSSIFNKFFRADNAIKQQTDGSGLGLFISKSIIEKHGGALSFTSTEGRGTTLYFTIPVSTDDLGTT